MGANDGAVVQRQAQHGGGFASDKAVAGAMEAVAAHAVLAVQRHRYGVQIGVLRHGLVEGGIEHGDLRQAGEAGLCGANAQQVGRVVQRGQAGAVFNGGQHAVVNQGRGVEVFAAVYHTVANSSNAARQCALVQVGQDGFHGAGVVALCQCQLYLLASLFEGDAGAGHAQFFCQATQGGFLGVGVDQGEFQRRAAAIDDESVGGHVLSVSSKTSWMSLCWCCVFFL